jgi:hypothetical protein
MSRYIDAEKIVITAERGVSDDGLILIPMIDAQRSIDATSTADVVEVVRCKDCEYWKDTSDGTVTEAHWGECRKPLGDYRYSETAENDYCSYGERREQNEG